MILWISISVIIISFILLIISEDRCWDAVTGLSLVFLVLSIMLSFGLGIASIIAKTGSEAYLASMQEERAALVYQLENDLYDNDNDLGKKELYSEITEYNCDVAEGKIMQDNIWVYNLYADVYDELELIEFPEE